jgi:EmrB/QacA subfamily drug resistance transporter
MENQNSSGSLRWWILLTVIVGTFLGRLDQTIVNLALPKIIDDFAITVSQASWIATAYILANAVFVPVWGKLGDTLGRKKIYIIGFTVFIIGSVLAGLSWDLNSMILFRIIQAVASSADYPTAMAILAVTFKAGKERAQALGIWSVSFAAASVFGPLLGGPLIDNFGWRWVFLINLPIGIIGLFMAIVFVEESVSERPTVRFDWWGSITLGIALSALVLVLDKGLEWGWFSAESVLCYAAVVFFGVMFYLIDRDHPEPIVDFKFFRIGAFVTTLTNNFVIFMGMMGGVFLLPIFAQTYMGYDATQTGFLFMPMAFGMVIASPLGASLTGKVAPRYVIAASTLGAAVGLYLFTGLDARSGPMDVMIPIVVMAFSMGFGMAQRTNVIASIVPTHEMGIASSVLALARNIAGAFGIAIFATILNQSTEDNVLSLARYSTVNTVNPLVRGQATALIILRAQIEAYHTVFIYAAALLLVGAVLALTIKVDERKDAGHVMIE